MRQGTARPPTEDPALADVRRELVAICRRLDALERPRHPRDPAQDARLMSAIASAFGGAAFAVPDLLAASDPELRAVLHGLSPRACGAWLKRLRRQSVAPYVLRILARDSGGSIWALCVSDESHTRSLPSGRRGAG